MNNDVQVTNKVRRSHSPNKPLGEFFGSTLSDTWFTPKILDKERFLAYSNSGVKLIP
jgi:hypothetical protein